MNLLMSEWHDYATVGDLYYGNYTILAYFTMVTRVNTLLRLLRYLVMNRETSVMKQVEKYQHKDNWVWKMADTFSRLQSRARKNRSNTTSSGIFEENVR